MLSKTERNERLRILLGNIEVRSVLERYDVEVLDTQESRKGGMELICACPFHPTNSPNFYINDENGRFICRSAFCGVAGDLIQFVSKKEEVSHQRAFDQLCNWAGIDPQDVSPLAITMSVIKQIGRRKQSSEVLKASPMPYPYGYKVLAHPYLVKARGIDPGVLLEARAGGVLEDDFYKYRACVPVEMRGKLFSLYSRYCGPDEKALKHHYSGESFTSHLLYGLDYAVEAGQGEVILVEAIISVLKLRTLGFPNAVAMLKAGVSDQQILRMIEKRVNRVIVCGDNDEKTDVDTGEVYNPGMRASWNTYRRIRKHFDTGVARLPLNVDPADMDEADDFWSVYNNTLWPSGKMKAQQQIQRFFQQGG